MRPLRSRLYEAKRQMSDIQAQLTGIESSLDNQELPPVTGIRSPIPWWSSFERLEKAIAVNTELCFSIENQLDALYSKKSKPFLEEVNELFSSLDFMDLFGKITNIGKGVDFDNKPTEEQIKQFEFDDERAEIKRLAMFFMEQQFNTQSDKGIIEVNFELFSETMINRAKVFKQKLLELVK